MSIFHLPLVVFLLGANPALAKKKTTTESGKPAASKPQPHVRPSLREMGGRLQKSEEISALFKESLKDPEALTSKKLAVVEKPNSALLREFQNLALDSASFVRGEIEDEAVLSRLLSLQQLSLLRVRLWTQDDSTPRNLGNIKEECNAWFQFAADLPYNEASMMGLKVTGLVRSLVLDELERLETKRGAQMAEDEFWLHWFLLLRTPWPVDRMILTEARRVLHPASLNLAEKVAAKIQKNPYLSVDQALKQIPGGKPQELDHLKPLWRTQDMEGMKMEINRLQTLRLRLASRIYEKRKGSPPSSVEQLISERLLTVAPTDYFTGHPMQLPQAGKSGDTGKNP